MLKELIYLYVLRRNSKEIFGWYLSTITKQSVKQSEKRKIRKLFAAVSDWRIPCIQKIADCVALGKITEEEFYNLITKRAV